MHRPFLGGQQQAQAIPFAAPTWYQPPTVTPSISSTYPSATPGMGPPSDANMSMRLNSVVNQGSNSRPFSPAPNAQLSDMLPALQEKSLDELNQLLTDKKAYNSFLHSLEPVRHLDLLRGELMKGHADHASNNLAKESQIAELRNQILMPQNFHSLIQRGCILLHFFIDRDALWIILHFLWMQCTIIRTTELATAREKFEEVQKREKEITAIYSSPALLDRLQEAAAKVDDESEMLHQKLVSGNIELSEFIQKYRKERILYHRRMLIHLGAKTSLGSTV